jgi:hypothetical protein
VQQAVGEQEGEAVRLTRKKQPKKTMTQKEGMIPPKHKSS